MIGSRNLLYVSFLYLISIYSFAKGTCPLGWNETEGTPLGCYKVSWEQKSYQEHEVSCRDNGGHLASIHSVNELRAVTSLLLRENGNFFIGLTDISKEGKWEYSDATPFDFENWEYGEPNNLGDEDCVEMKNSGKWNDISCSRRCGAVCKLEKTDYTVGNEYATDYKTTMMEHSDIAITTAESKILTEFVTDVHSERSVSSELKEFSMEHFSTEHNERNDNTVGNEYVTDYVTIMMEPSERNDNTVGNEYVTDYVTIMMKPSDSTVTTAETEFLTEYATDVYSESTVTSEINEFPTEHFSTEYSAVTSTENEFLTEYLTKGFRDADENCPGEWLRYNNFCFFLDTTKRMFRDAKIACKTRGGKLASIHSKEEQSFVYSILREDVQSYFIGLTFDTQSKTWNYTDGTTLDFTNWYPNMPDRQEVETCVEVYFYHDGKWNDVSCFSPFNGAVCKAPLGSSLVSGPLNEPDRTMIECGNGWLNYYDESLYCFTNILLQWTEAAQMCADYGGHLVSIQDKYENDFLVKSMENFHVEFVWIGMSDLHEEGVWRWENSHIIPSYTNWDYLEPNNFHNEDCAVMYLFWNFRPRKGSWYDNPCCHEFPFICKKQF